MATAIYGQTYLQPSRDRVIEIGNSVLMCTLWNPCTISANFAGDIVGRPDSRPGTWGTEGHLIWPIRFWPPAGQRVRITQVAGDLVAWVRGAVPADRKAGVLLGLQTTAPEGSVHCDWCADNTFLYIQDAVDGNKTARAGFDRQLGNIRLGPDHVMQVKVAAWLNDTGQPVHVEPTLTVTFFFEPGGASQ